VPRATGVRRLSAWSLTISPSCRGAAAGRALRAVLCPGGAGSPLSATGGSAAGCTGTLASAGWPFGRSPAVGRGLVAFVFGFLVLVLGAGVLEVLAIVRVRLVRRLVVLGTVFRLVITVLLLRKRLFVVLDHFAVFDHASPALDLLGVEDGVGH